MKKGDFIWGGFLLLIIALLVLSKTKVLFLEATAAHPYCMGFFKFALLASMGELLAIRITTGVYTKPIGLLYKAFVWGFIGVVIVIIFRIFSVGVHGLLDTGLLPFKNSTLSFAFFTSLLMNTTFAPTMMAFHRVTDTIIDNKYIKKTSKISHILEKIDWNAFIKFVIFKTIPFFWIPAHTITFLLPSEYRVLMAAFLSIALGAILAFAKKKGEKNYLKREPLTK